MWIRRVVVPQERHFSVSGYLVRRDTLDYPFRILPPEGSSPAIDPRTYSRTGIKTRYDHMYLHIFSVCRSLYHCTWYPATPSRSMASISRNSPLFTVTPRHPKVFGRPSPRTPRIVLMQQGRACLFSNHTSICMIVATRRRLAASRSEDRGGKGRCRAPAAEYAFTMA